jgi:hypothetical protein
MWKQWKEKNKFRNELIKSESINKKKMKQEYIASDEVPKWESGKNK